MTKPDSGDTLAELTRIIEDALILALLRQGIDAPETEPIARSIAQAIEAAVEERTTDGPRQALRDGLDPQDLSSANDI
jgi:hypothetical protein